ncbi:MAG: transposase [Modestobacter sp.]|nr:transposase [Modestobacter sp.]
MACVSRARSAQWTATARVFEWLTTGSASGTVPLELYAPDRAVRTSHRAYGAPRVTAELNDGVPPQERVNHKRVARVMAEIAGIRLRRRMRTTHPRPGRSAGA